MPAVDSPGSPGMTFDELERIISGFLASGRIVGLDLTIYDPDLDPTGRYARDIVRSIERAFRSWRGWYGKQGDLRLARWPLARHSNAMAGPQAVGNSKAGRTAGWEKG